MTDILKEKKHGRVSNRPNDWVLLMEYTDMTAPELAKKYGVATSTVRLWIRSARQNLAKQQRIDSDKGGGKT